MICYRPGGSPSEIREVASYIKYRAEGSVLSRVYGNREVETMNDVAVFLMEGKDFNQGETFQSIMILESLSCLSMSDFLRLSILYLYLFDE